MAGDKKGKLARFFAPIPARAVGDRRLKGLHWQVLAVIALHDRMGKNGQGCWASNKRLAEMIECNYTNLSTALTELGRWGYLEQKPHPLNRRRRVLFVIYDEAADAAVMKPAKADDSLRTGKPSDPKCDDDSLRGGKDDAGTVCPDFQEAASDQSLRDGESIPRSGEAYPPEGATSDSAEAAPRGCAMPREGRAEKRDRDGEDLAQIQRWLKTLEGQELTKDHMNDLLRHRDYCDKVEAKRAAPRDAVHAWAHRLADEITTIMESWL